MNVDTISKDTACVGSLIKWTKTRVRWRVSVNGKPHEVVVLVSLISGKIRLKLDNQPVFEDRELLQNNHKINFSIGGSPAQVICANHVSDYKLYINDVLVSDVNKSVKPLTDSMQDTSGISGEALQIEPEKSKSNYLEVPKKKTSIFDQIGPRSREASPRPAEENVTVSMSLVPKVVQSISPQINDNSNSFIFDGPKKKYPFQQMSCSDLSNSSDATPLSNRGVGDSKLDQFVGNTINSKFVITSIPPDAGSPAVPQVGLSTLYAAHPSVALSIIPQVKQSVSASNVPAVTKSIVPTVGQPTKASTNLEPVFLSINNEVVRSDVVKAAYSMSKA